MPPQNPPEPVEIPEGLPEDWKAVYRQLRENPERKVPPQMVLELLDELAEACKAQ